MQTLFNIFTPYKPYITKQLFAVAVSGGADSLALCLLLNTWAQKQGFELIALTVDHKLRNNSTQEATQVKSWLAQHNIKHVILTWQHPPIDANIQAAARTARYELLTNYCNQHNISALFLAHHMLDQYETFFMRLSHASGLKGLTGIHPVSLYNDIHIIRPLLNTHPSVLKQYLIDNNQLWIEDPSNEDVRFERIQWRKHTDTLSSMGLLPSTLMKACKKLTEEDEALDWSVNTWLQQTATFDDRFYFVHLPCVLHTLPPAFVKRIMLQVMSFVRNTPITSYNLRNYLDGPLEKLRAQPFKPFTAGGCYWFTKNSRLYVVREWGKCPTVQVQTPLYLYDNRFTLTAPPLNTIIEPVSNAHWPQFKALIPKNSIPYEVFLSLPCSITQDGKLNSLSMYNTLF